MRKATDPYRMGAPMTTGTPPVRDGTHGRSAGKRVQRFTAARKQAFLDALPAAKGNLTLAAKLAHVSLPTVFDHLHQDAAFVAQVNRAKAMLSHTLVEVAYQRGLQPSGVHDRWRLIHAWNPAEYAPTPTMQVTVNHAQLAFGDGSPAFSHALDVVKEAGTE